MDDMKLAIKENATGTNDMFLSARRYSWDENNNRFIKFHTTINHRSTFILWSIFAFLQKTCSKLQLMLSPTWGAREWHSQQFPIRCRQQSFFVAGWNVLDYASNDVWSVKVRSWTKMLAVPPPVVCYKWLHVQMGILTAKARWRSNHSGWASISNSVHPGSINQ